MEAKSGLKRNRKQHGDDSRNNRWQTSSFLKRPPAKYRIFRKHVREECFFWGLLYFLN